MNNSTLKLINLQSYFYGMPNCLTNFSQRCFKLIFQKNRIVIQWDKNILTKTSYYNHIVKAFCATRINIKCPTNLVRAKIHYSYLEAS